MRDCENCKHRIMKVEVGKGTPPEHFWGCECWECEFEPTTKNNLGVDCIDKTELLKAMDTWDKFGNDPNEGLIPLRTPALQDRYVPYVKYEDMVNCVKGMSSVTPQERKGHWIPTYGNVECSVCGSVKDSREVGRATHYCDFCGAKMVESQESEDKE